MGKEKQLERKNKIRINNFRQIECYISAKEFFDEIYSGVYRYQIMMPRKMIGLDKVFGKTTNCCSRSDAEFYPIFMTSQSYILYIDRMAEEIKNQEIEKLQNKFISVTDDILLHGRTLNAFLKNIIQLLCEKTGKVRQEIVKLIDVNIFAKSDCVCLLDQQNYCKLNVKVAMRDNECKRLSDVIMNTFYEMAVSNTSTIPNFIYKESINISYKKLKQKIQEKLKDNGGKWIVVDLNEVEKDSIYRKIVQEKNMNSMIIYPKDQYSNTWAGFQCLRVYYNEYLEQLYMIPYVFLRQMLQDQLKENFKKLKKRIPELSTCDLDNKSRKEYGILQYELLTCFASIAYGHEMMGENQDVLEKFEIDDSVMQLSYGTEIAQIIKKYAKDIEFKNLQLNYKDETLSYRGDIELQNIYENILKEKNQKKVYQLIESYFHKNGTFDENQARKKVKTRSEGLMLDYMEHLYSNWKEESNVDFYCALISTMDRGVSALKVKAFNVKDGDKNVVYGDVMQAGEQAYRICLEELMPIFHFQIRLKKWMDNRFCDERYVNQKLRQYVENVFDDLEEEEFRSIYRDAIGDEKTDYLQYYNIQRSESELRRSPLYEKAKENFERMIS